MAVLTVVPTRDPDLHHSHRAGAPTGVAASAAIIVSALLALATAAWLVPASIHVVSWGNNGAGRVALFAPVFWFPRLLVVALVLAACLWWIGSRSADARANRAHIIAPLSVLWAWTIPFLPLLPDRLPLLLVLAGPLRWAIAAGALVAVVGRAFGGRFSVAMPLWPGRKTACALAFAVYLISGYRSIHQVGLGGDEPHYLVLTQSVLLDHDLKIENNHQRADYRQYFGGVLRPDYLTRGVDGEIYSIHAPGLPVLVLPAFVIAGAWGAVVMMCMFGALASLAVFDLAALVGGTRAAWATWASVSFTVPFIPHAWAIFPEMAGAAIVAWGLLWAVQDDDASLPAWIWRGVCLGALPWLHTKFSVFLAVLALALAWRARRRISQLVMFAAPIAVLSVLWIAFFIVIYGTPDPQAPYGAYTAQFVRFENLPRSLAGAFFDQKFGLFVYAPVYLAAAWGSWLLLKDERWRWTAMLSVGLAGLYIVSSARLYMWWGGSSAPARFLVPVVPLLAPALGAAFARVRSRLATAHLWIALAASLVVSVVSVADLKAPLLFSNPHGVARLAELLRGGSPLPMVLPTFTEENWLVPAGRLALWLLAALVAVAAASWWSRRRTGDARASAASTVFWTLCLEGALGLAGVALVASAASADARAETVRHGRFGLLQAFDPDARRAFDYRSGSLSKMTPQKWTDASSLTFRLAADEAPDPQGRLTEGLALPPGVYRVSVTFDDSAPRDGELRVALGGGNVLARVASPIPAMATMRVAMPIPVPQVWVQMSDAASASAARRVDVVPESIVAVHERVQADVRRVESVDGRADAYLAYANDGAFAEGGVFWTRGTSEAELLVAPAGSPVLNVTIHAGPAGSVVRVRLNTEQTGVTLAANETRTIALSVPAGASVVRLAVQSSTEFRPSDVDPGSTDSRMLGCQVRVGVAQ